MTKEEKQLLLKDLCARLPYGVICVTTSVYYDNNDNEVGQAQGRLVSINRHGATFVDDRDDTTFGADFEDNGQIGFKPYLRPLSSMTDEEEESLREDTGLDIFKCTVNKELEDLWSTDCSVKDLFCLYSWLNEHHFDYNGLIEKGLALEAPADMYKNG